MGWYRSWFNIDLLFCVFRPPQSKELQSDKDYDSRMYVKDVTEVEVRTTEEAFNVFLKGDDGVNI